ncbi:hypothetical protein Nepgr_007334 [Nepenthes gracilis]|uniref:Nudix hydrolase domain-containing protein n=1 Tax=Nepenthes gracilis TaxID=150966 RepID=A0AAD3S6X2_NEPGR|nr:hypothetical protein Nepgr_007334 [Nepenthes gracilis]
MLRGGSRSQRLTNLAQLLRPYNPSFSTAAARENQIQGSEGCTANPIPHCPARSTPKRAAVLICIFEGDDGHLRVILTQRSSTLSSHSGEVALPGGKVEEGDADDVATALREAKEEIGLDPSLVDVVAVLEPFSMKRPMIVVPVIGLLRDKKSFCPTPNAAEVEVVFDAPLEMFLKDEDRREEDREWMGEKYLIHFFDYEADNRKHVIFGLTAGILIKAASIVYQRSPNFIEKKPNFRNNKNVEKTVML